MASAWCHPWDGTPGVRLESKINALLNRIQDYFFLFLFFCFVKRCGRDYCDKDEIMSIADAMASNGMKELGYEYINMDGKKIIFLNACWIPPSSDCWADHRDSDGTIVPDENRFPE